MLDSNDFIMLIVVMLLLILVICKLFELKKRFYLPTSLPTQPVIPPITPPSIIKTPYQTQI